MAVTTQRVEAGLQVVRAMAEAIRDLGSVPSGHLYARLMGRMDLQSYEGLIGILVRSGLVTQDASHVLHWVG